MKRGREEREGVSKKLSAKLFIDSTDCRSQRQVHADTRKEFPFGFFDMLYCFLFSCLVFKGIGIDKFLQPIANDSQCAGNICFSIIRQV